MSTDIDKKIGANIRNERIKAGRSQTWLAKSLKEPVTFQMVQKYENGSRVPPGVLVEFSLLFGVPVTNFFEGVTALIGNRACEPGLPIDMADSHKLVRDYSRIPDPEVRRAIRGMVKALAIGAANTLKGGMA